jgi:hypothetical protein
VAKLAGEGDPESLTMPICVAQLVREKREKESDNPAPQVSEKERGQTHVHILARQTFDELVVAIGLERLLSLQPL